MRWTPFTGPQTLACQSKADELFYGGAAGGGKSDLLLGMAGTAHRSSIIFRREFPLLRGLIERSREIFNQENASHLRDSFNESLHVWRLNDGRMIEFGAIQYEHDRENFRGRPHDFYGWDEVAQFSESQFRFVNAWNRTTLPGQRCRVVATGNPPTSAEGEWVIRYWAPWLDPHSTRPAEPGELRWFIAEDGKDIEVEGGEPLKVKGELVQPRSRTFIPARLADNPALMATGYAAVLQGLPEPLRSQMLYGDFSLALKDDAYQVLPTALVRAAMARWAPLPTDSAQTALGVDVARGGEDQLVIAPLHGRTFAPLIKIPGVEVPTGQAAAGRVLLAHAGGVIGIDVIGIGASATDHLQEAGVGPIPVNFGEATDETDRTGHLHFRNVRSAAYWKFREVLEETDPEKQIALPNDPELLADLCAARLERDELQGGKIALEPKEKIKKRLGRSPDCADAVVIAWHVQAGGEWFWEM